VEVGQQSVDQPQEEPAEDEAGHRRHPRDATEIFGEGDRRRQQREEGGGDHHPGRGTQRGVEDPAVERDWGEDEAGAERGQSPGEERRDERLNGRVERLQPIDHQVSRPAKTPG
jgi:hypothetical protein